MTKHQSRVDAGQGEPNMEALAYLQANWGENEIHAAMRVVKTSLTSTTTGTSGVTVNIPVGATIIDAHVVCTSTVGSGSITVKDGNGNAITDAIACATDKAIARAGSIDDLYRVVTADGVKIVANSNSDRGDAYIVYTK